MPITQDPQEHYHNYCLSQQRVERWVQETDKQLQQIAQLAQSQSQSHEVASKEPYQLPSPPATLPAQAVDDARPRTSHRSSSSKPHGTHAVSRSRSRPSSGSKKISSGSRKRRTETPASLLTYLPYGILPLLFAVTGTSVISVIFAVVLLAGYVVSAMEESESSRSSRKHIKRP